MAMKLNEEVSTEVTPDPARTTQMKKAFDYTPACWCKDADEIEECDHCGVVWNYDKERWDWAEEGTKYTFKCRHYDDAVKFPDGTVVYASSMHDRSFDDETPDWGLYLDSGWAPNGMAGIIDWPDYDIPTNYYTAAYMIIDAYRKAKAGYWVEVGCIGGHGRTGTVLACMAVLGGVSHRKAVQWVRQNYCKDAVECKEQAWFVSWFRSFVFGGTSKPFPAKEQKYRTQYTYEQTFDWENVNLLEEIGRRPTAPRGKVYHRSTLYPIKPKNEYDVTEDDSNFWRTLSEEEKIEFLNDSQPMSPKKPDDPTPEEQAALEDWVDEYLRLTSKCPCQSGEKVMNCSCDIYTDKERTFVKIGDNPYGLKDPSDRALIDSEDPF